MNRAVFLDRDGTLIREVNYCSRPEDVHLLPGVPEALKLLHDAGYLLIIITNQSGIGRGYFTEEDYRRTQEEVLRQGGRELIAATYYCPAAPDTHDPRRKPEPGMLLDAARDWNISLPDSYMIGDKNIDVQAGKNAGTQTILVRTGYGEKEAEVTEADFVADDLLAAAEWISRK